VAVSIDLMNYFYTAPMYLRAVELEEKLGVEQGLGLNAYSAKAEFGLVKTFHEKGCYVLGKIYKF